MKISFMPNRHPKHGMALVQVFSSLRLFYLSLAVCVSYFFLVELWMQAFLRLPDRFQIFFFFFFFIYFYFLMK